MKTNKIHQAVGTTLPADVSKEKPLIDNQPSWDELKDTKDEVSSLLVQFGESARDIVAAAKDKLEPKDKRDLSLVINTFNSDMEKIADDILRIEATHAHKTGIPKREREVNALFRTGLEYQGMVNVIDTTLSPTLETITNICSKAMTLEELVEASKALFGKPDNTIPLAVPANNVPVDTSSVASRMLDKAPDHIKEETETQTAEGDKSE